MSDVLERLYTAVDTVTKFFNWCYDLASVLVDYIAEKFNVILDVCAAIPPEWGIAFAAMAACAVLYLALGR